jgi:cell division protein FtsW
MKQNEYRYCLLIIGIISLIGVQVIINLGVVVGLLPVTGITLPFISYGGSSLISYMIIIGILINISSEKIAKYN